MSSNPAPTPPNSPENPAPAPKRKRRRWLKIIGALLIVLILLVLCAPMLLSTGPVRAFAISQVNNSLNGKLAVGDWSLGWFSGIYLRDIKLDDAKGRRVFECNSVAVPAGIAQLVRGNLHLGNIVIDEPNLVLLEIDKDGHTNFDDIAKPSAKVEKKETPKPASESKVPDVSLKLTVNKFRAAVSGSGVPAPIEVRPSDIVVDIPNINAPITNTVHIAYTVGSSPESTIDLAGTVAAIANNRPLPGDKIKADQKLTLSNVVLAALEPFLRKAGQDMKLAGIVNGGLAIKSDGTGNASIQGVIPVTELSVSGGPLKGGDSFYSKTLNVPIDITASQAAVKIARLAIESPLFNVQVNGELPQEAIKNLAEQKAPGANGNIAVSLDVTDLPTLTERLRNTLALQKDVQLTGGKIAAKTNIALTPEAVTLTQDALIEAAGKNAGRDVRLEPVALKKFAVTARPAGKDNLPVLSDIALDMTSAFLTATGGGKSLADIAINGQMDLAKAQQQAGQFADLGALQLSGAGTFNVASKGDFTQPGGTAAATFALNLVNLVVKGLKDRQDIAEPRLVAGGSATLVRGEKDFIQQIRDVAFTAQAGEENALVLDLAAAVPAVSLAPISATSAQLTKLNVDLARLQQQFGGLIPALKDVQISDGQLYTTATATYANDAITLDKPFSLSIRNLSLAKNGNPVLKRENIAVNVAGKVAMPKDKPITADLSALSVTISTNLLKLESAQPIAVALAPSGGIAGNGAIKLSSDLKRLMDVAQAFGGQVKAQTGAGQLTSGLLDAMLRLDHPPAASATAITLDGTIDNLSVTTNDQPINEKVTITLAASSPDDFSAVTVSKGGVSSSFASLALGETIVNLKATNVWDQLAKAGVEINIPDIPKAQAIANAFTPPATQPTTQPLNVTSGSANIKLALSRANQTTTLDIPTITLTNLQLSRGGQSFAFQQGRSINLKLATEIATAAAEIGQLKLTALSGDLGIAQLAMPEPIIVTSLASNPAVNGAITLTGSIAEAERLLAVLGSSPAMTYAGNYTVTQKFSTQANRIAVAGTIAVPDLQTDAQAKPQNLAVKNDLLADTAAKTATINELSVSMPDTRAAAATLKGQVAQWDTTRTLNNITLDLSYDLAQLWPLVKPMLSPETQESLKDLKLAGAYSKQFHVSGTYPAGVPSNQAIQSLKADGAVGVGLLDTSGINLQNFELPFALEAGRGSTAGMKPATFNNGTLDLANATLDLTGDTPRLFVKKKHPLVRSASINTLLGDTLGKYVNPVFTNSKRAQGLLDVTINQCDNLALGEKMKSPESGRAVITFSLSDMDIANPVGSLIFGSVISQGAKLLGGGGVSGEADTFQGSIKDGLITVDAGRTTQDITFMLRDPARPPGAVGSSRQPVDMPMTFKGDIALATLQQRLDVSLPTPLMNKFIPDRNMKEAMFDAFPTGIPIVMKGTTPKPEVSVGDIFGKIAEAQAKSQLGKLLGGDKKDSGKKGGGSNDPVGGLLDQLGGKKKK